MPPNGLYLIPRQHLYGGSPQLKRRSFNTMDVQKEEEERAAKAAIKEEARVVDDLGSGQHKKKDKSKKDKKKKRESKKARRSLNVADGSEDAPAEVDDDAARSVSSSKSKTKRKLRDTEDKRSSGKKRKRDSNANFESPSVARTEHGDDTLLGEDWLEGVRTSIGDIGSFFDGSPAPTEAKKESKNKESSMRKSTSSNATDTTVETERGGPVRPVKEFTTSEVPPAKKQKSKKNKSLVDNSTKIVPDASIKASPYEHVPRQTPVPLPQQSTLRPSHVVGSLIKPYKAPSRTESEILVNETPPSQMPRESITPWKTPIPFSLSKTAVSNKAAPGTFLASSQTTNGTRTPSSLFRRTAKDDIEPSSQDSLTASNLLRYTQPLNDDPKPRPTGRGSSVASDRSMSIKDAIARMGKPSPTTSEVNPFFTPSSKKKVPTVELHAEAPAHTFTKTFAASQATVNFTLEATYLADHLSYRASAGGPPPCLKSATGCTAKAEQVLRLLNSEPSSLLKLTSASAAQHAAFDAAVKSTLEAERFLRNAVATRIPVPLGQLDGVYTLYCPSYAAAHVDRYGFGSRTLSIARPSGFTKSSHTYTARLSIPPSPVACTLLAFTPAPHASFRTTTLTTSAEGYAMGLVCLGNGYVLLRVDMGLLITGKRSERGKEMEFVGVREGDGRGMGAVKWAVVGEDEKKGGEGEGEGEMAKGGSGTPARKVGERVEASPTKKKRGRPTNEEKERRAAEAAGREA